MASTFAKMSNMRGVGVFIAPKKSKTSVLAETQHLIVNETVRYNVHTHNHNLNSHSHVDRRSAEKLCFCIVSENVPIHGNFSREFCDSVDAWFGILIKPIENTVISVCTSTVGADSTGHLGSLTAANWVSLDFNVSYSSC